MPRQLSEDEVRDASKILLGFQVVEPGVQQGTGQLTTFNMLGIEGVNDKPDGWYFPANKNDVAIILETKSSREDISARKWVAELRKNCEIARKAGWTKVVGLLYNGYQTLGFLNSEPLEIPSELQNKQYYLRLVNDRVIDKEKIYRITERINDCLHHEFGIKNLYHRMIFTACALVAERFGARLQNVKDMGYDVFQRRIFEVLNKSMQEDLHRNAKIDLLLKVYSEIRMNIQENQKAINKFLDCVCEISDCINSNEWRGEDVMGIFFNEFNRYKKKSESGQVFTPEHITSFMYRLIGVTPNDFVGDFCCGSGAFLVKSMSNMMRAVGGYEATKSKEIRQTHLYGIEFDREIYALACANMMIHKDGKTNLAQMDTRNPEACDWIREKGITKVLMNPPYENKYGCMRIVENVLDSVKAGADCAFILPDKKLEKTSKRTMDTILAHHRLVQIVKLPEQLFNEGVTTSIFVFKAHEPQGGQEIFGCYMKEDGLETVKNKGRHDVRNRWQAIEDYWIDSIMKRRDERFGTVQWIKPKEHLSYQMPEKEFKVSEADFRKTAMDYLMFREELDAKEFGEKLAAAVLYASTGEVSALIMSAFAERKETGAEELTTDGWKKVRLDTVFEMRNTKSIVQKSIVPGSGEVPYVTAQAGRNGVLTYIDCPKEWLDEGGCIMIGGKTMTFSYQEEAFCSNDSHNIALYFKAKEHGSVMCALFLITVLRASLQERYSWGDSVSMKRIKDETFYLPVRQDGDPNYEYMAEFMGRIYEESEKSMGFLKEVLRS